MNANDAMALAAELASAYPGRSVGELSLVQYAKALGAHDQTTAIAAIGDLVTRYTDHPPTYGAVVEALRMREPVQRTLIASPPPPDGTYLDEDVQAHGWFHLRRFFRGLAGHREAMHEPWTCDCDWKEQISA